MSKYNNNYAKIINFGGGLSNASGVNDPIVTSVGTNIDQKFVSGSESAMIAGQFSKASQAYMADYCAVNFDGICEFASNNKNYKVPNNLDFISNGIACQGLNQGEMLIRNTASKKYLTELGNCFLKQEPYNFNDPSSPIITTFVNNSNASGAQCVPVYRVDPLQIDSDVVMDKILSNPKIGIDILINIFNTMTRDGSISQLKGTKLGKFFDNNDAFFAKKGYLNRPVPKW